MGFYEADFPSGIISMFVSYFDLSTYSGFRRRNHRYAERKADQFYIVTLKEPFQPKAGLVREGEMGMKKIFACKATGGI